MSKKLIIILLIAIFLFFVFNVSSLSELYSQDNADITILIEELTELSKIGKEDRSVGQWDRIIGIILKTSFLSVEDIGDVYLQLQNQLVLHRELNSRQEVLNQEKESLNQQLNHYVELSRERQEYLEALVSSYEDKLKESDSSSKRNIALVGIDMDVRGNVDISLGYGYIFSFGLYTGGNLNFKNIVSGLDKNSFVFGIGLGLGYAW